MLISILKFWIKWYRCRALASALPNIIKLKVAVRKLIKTQRIKCCNSKIEMELLSKYHMAMNYITIFQLHEEYLTVIVQKLKIPTTQLGWLSAITAWKENSEYHNNRKGASLYSQEAFNIVSWIVIYCSKHFIVIVRKIHKQIQPSGYWTCCNIINCWWHR